MSRPHRPDSFMFGRERELRVIEEQLDSVSDRGIALLIRGEAGVGKTAILEAAKSRAAVRDMSLLGATGVQRRSRPRCYLSAAVSACT